MFIIESSLTKRFNIDLLNSSLFYLWGRNQVNFNKGRKKGNKSCEEGK